MHKITVECANGKFKGPQLCSSLLYEFDKVYGNAKKEYQLLDELYQQQEVQNNIDFDQQMHGGRDRYSDIITYYKSQVQLLNGVGGAKHSQYINCCFVNNVFTFDQAEEKYGNKKIIAS